MRNAIVAPYIVLDILRMCNFLAYSAAHNHKTNDEMNGTQRLLRIGHKICALRVPYNNENGNGCGANPLSIAFASFRLVVRCVRLHLICKAEKQNTMRQNDCAEIIVGLQH